MASEVKLPRLGQGMESGVVTKWLKNGGDQVATGEPPESSGQDNLGSIRLMYTVIASTTQGVPLVVKHFGAVFGAEMREAESHLVKA